VAFTYSAAGMATIKDDNLNISLTSAAIPFYSTVEYNYLQGGAVLGARTFATLGPPSNGALIYCADCAQARACRAGGSGALAKGVSSSWQCN